MSIEIKQEKIKIGGEQLYTVFVNGEEYGKFTYEELMKITIGDLDRVEV